MSYTAELDPKLNIRKKFYDRRRADIKESQSEERELWNIGVDRYDSSPLDTTETPEDTIFGRITRQELDTILKSYEQQQTSAKTKDTPVKCEVPGGSYADLLLSKPAFHHLGATQYLVQKLGINDVQRYSFLGGLSNYASEKDDDVVSLMKAQDRLKIRLKVKKIEDLLNQRYNKEAKVEIDELAKIDKRNADFLAIRGRYGAAMGKYIEAIDDLKKALEGNPSELAQVKMLLSDCLQQISDRHYVKREYKESLRYCHEALLYNPDNQRSRTQLSMNESKIRDSIPFAQKSLQYRK